MRDLIILNKFPCAGRSKTRLGKDIGYRESAHIAKLLLEDFVDNASRVCDVTVACSIEDAGKFLGHYPGLNVYGGAEGLFHRLSESVRHQYNDKNTDKVIVATGDIIASEGKIDEWFKELSSYDLSVGPTKDFRFYRAGLTKKFGEKFSRSLSENPNLVRFLYAGARALFSFPKIKIGKTKRDIDTLYDLCMVKPDDSTSSKETLDYIDKIINENV